MKEVLFSETILYTDIENKEIDKLFLSVLKKQKRIQNNKSMVNSNRGGFQTDNITDKTLGTFLMKNAGDLLTTNYTFKNNIKLTLSNFWINENYKYNYNRSHLHLGINNDTGLAINYSGIYYIQVPKEDPGDIYFESNDISRLNLEVLNRSVENHPDFRTEVHLTPINNKFVVFPSYLRHGVESNLSNKKRISVAFNFTVQKD
jgi:uncharacterized protein (TIGR02466 family)